MTCLPHPIHFSFLILGEWAGEFTFTGTVLRKPGTWLSFQGASVYVRHMINYWISFPTFLPRWWCAHPQGPSPRHLWLASLAVFFPIIGDCASMPSISPGQGLRFMEGKFSLTQFSPCEQEERMGLINVLPHYGQGHPMHSCRPVLGAHGPLPSAPSHTSDGVRHQWTQLPFHWCPCLPSSYFFAEYTACWGGWRGKRTCNFTGAKENGQG